MAGDGVRLSGRSLILILAAIVLIIGGFEFSWKRRAPQFAFRACFQDAGKLRERAPVVVGGIASGYVSRLSTHPGDADCPVEAEMVLTSNYEVTVTADSTVSLETFGRDESEVVIHIEHASGPPLEPGGKLKSTQ